MSQPLRIGFFVGCFPVLSETFILRQITGLLQLGHDVRIFAGRPKDFRDPIQPEVEKFNLLARTTYVKGPEESLVWELPVLPLFGRTWLPGETRSIPNWQRLARAAPSLFSCALRNPRLTAQALSKRRYGYQASSLSTLYRLATLIRFPQRFQVLHAHFGTVGNSYRFARQLWRAPLVVSFHGYDFRRAHARKARPCTIPCFESPTL